MQQEGWREELQKNACNFHYHILLSLAIVEYFVLSKCQPQSNHAQ